MPSLVARLLEQIELIWSSRREMPEPAGLLQESAERLCMSRWTLRRHLAQEGSSFQQVLDELRARRAQALLQDRNLSMLEISQRLGFSSQSSSTRFFRARFACAPGQARQAAVP